MSRQRLRKVAFVVASRNDLWQCVEGLEALIAAWENWEIEWVVLGNDEVSGEVLVTSIHRNPDFTDFVLGQLGSLDVDVAIIAAGWSNHISAGSDARLRNMFKNGKTVVVAVAIEDPENETHTLAACYGTSQVPGTQCVYQDESGEFVGSEGMERACRYALDCDLPEIKIPELRPPVGFDPYRALEIGREQRAQRAAD